MPLTPTRRSMLLGAASALLTHSADASLFHWHHRHKHPPSTHLLSNPQASPRAQKLYAYLWQIYGKQTLTGQQAAPRTGPSAELAYLQRVTGKQPAILGLDYIHPDEQAFVNDYATQWYTEQGGIPTICWHWGAPDIGTGYENSKKDFDLPAALRTGTPQHDALQRDLDGIADQLTVLRDRDIPVLWRPLHEFTGTWFWWGKHGPSAFKDLWILMYEFFTTTRGLNNLVWVAGFSGEPSADLSRAWYPGSQYVDIAGPDTYVKDHNNLAPLFAEVHGIVGDTKPICLHECGPIPDPDLLDDVAPWLYFMTWHTRFIIDNPLNPPDFLNRVYNSKRYLTLDQLPNLKDV
ncbi:MAG TPA: glycosyl hydrolase [Acidobacteriaceae bacterium]|nr:glycosyl hydrolase [Acidobacteriaceae bacterium]